MNIHRLVQFVSILILVAALSFQPGSAGAQTPRQVTATASCTEGNGTAPEVTVTITNDYQLRIHVAYLVSFSSPVAINASGLQGLLQVETPAQAVVDIDEGETVALTAPWAGRDVRADEVTSALIITSAGLLMPSCGYGVYQIENPNSTPVMAGEEGYESATIMAQVMGQLETFKAYPALYALLHSDVRANVPFEAVACSYAAEYGPPQTDKTLTIFSTTVTDVTWVDWSWAVTGKAYTSVAEVTYTQKVGLFPKSEVAGPMVEHLVREDGVWRWFFGSDADSVSGLPTECGLPAYT